MLRMHYHVEDKTMAMDLSGWQSEGFRPQWNHYHPTPLGTLIPHLSNDYFACYFKFEKAPRIVKILRGMKIRDIFCQPSLYVSFR